MPSLTSPDNPWAAEGMTTALRLLHDKGFSCSEIARSLNVDFGTKLSRNSIIGKLHRLGLNGVKNPAPRSTKRAELDPLRARAARRTLPPAPVEVPAEPARPAELPPAPDSPGVALADLREHHCRYPLWPDSERSGLYCGAERETRTMGTDRVPYCNHHCTVAFQAVQVRIRVRAELARVARRVA